MRQRQTKARLFGKEIFLIYAVKWPSFLLKGSCNIYFEANSDSSYSKVILDKNIFDTFNPMLYIKHKTTLGGRHNLSAKNCGGFLKAFKQKKMFLDPLFLFHTHLCELGSKLGRSKRQETFCLLNKTCPSILPLT